MDIQAISLPVLTLTQNNPLLPFAACTLFLSAFCVFFIWVVNTEVGVVAMNAIFNFVVNGAWNALDILSAESYPTELRYKC